MNFDAVPQVIGELPMDDVVLLEENYQKELWNLLKRRGVDVDKYNGRSIQLMPGADKQISYVCLMPQPPAVH